MTTSKKDPPSVDTGGGAYMGGRVDTGGGDFVGRDQVKTVHQQQGASVEDLARLLAEVRKLLPQAGLDPEVTEVIEGAFRVPEDQAAKDQPKGGIIKAKLKGISELIQETGKTSDAAAKILTLLGKGATPAGALFCPVQMAIPGVSALGPKLRLGPGICKLRLPMEEP